MSWFARIIAHHPWLVLVAVAVFSATCLLIPLTTVKLPNFKDPQMGFEARGTEVSERMVAWENLLEATRPSGTLTANPMLPFHNSFIGKEAVLSKSSFFSKEIRNINKTGLLNDLISPNFGKAFNISVVVEAENHRNYTEDSEDDWITRIKDDLSHHHHEHLSPDAFFCSSPRIEYGRVVMSTTDGSDLLKYEAVRRLCDLEQRLVSLPEYPSLCETVSKHRCCPAWSLPNYIAMLSNKSSCLDVTKEDVDNIRELLEICRHYYFDLQQMTDYDKKDIPVQCHRHNTVFNMIHFILDSEYKNQSTSLQNVMVFLPIARSSATLNYYYSLESSEMQIHNVAITAIDFGLKEILFDEWLVRDTRLIAVGAGFVLVSMWLYTGSIFLTLMTLLAIAFSIGIAYFVYTLIFEIKFFPFMNLLASVVAVGVGGDASLMMSKVWSYAKSEDSQISVTKLVQSSHNHSAMCMLVSSLTTAAAFYSSYISNVTAIRCFSIFAGTVVLANFLVMVGWLPAVLVVSERLVTFSWATSALTAVTSALRSTLVTVVLRLRFLWLIALGSIAILAGVAVFYHPRLRLPDTPDLQLFSSDHPFERYHLIYQDKFWFERLEKVEGWEGKLPLRFVWGVLAKDTGSFLDPSSKGKLQMDRKFDLADPESQNWLLSFCAKLRAQPFYQPTMGPLLPNCFIEAMVDWMKRRCSDPMGMTRAPCCENASFPYPRRIFSRCLAHAASSLYNTPASLAMPGVAGPKFSTTPPSRPNAPPKLKALVVEFDSNFTYSTSFSEMDNFYTQVETWFREELLTAPTGMRGGWFVSSLELYELQRCLIWDTVNAVAAALGSAALLVLFATLNFRLALAACFTVASVILVSIAVLVLLLGWRLNVLEAVATSTAVGLAVDFTIHYVVNYKMAPEKDKRESAVAYSITMMGGPTLMGAITTCGAGAVMLPSQVLAYTQVGMFLIVVMSISWIYSTLFLNSILAIVGPEGRERTRKGATREQHELGRLGRRGRRHPGADRSPSAASATTIIHDDEVSPPEAVPLPTNPP